MSDLEQLEYAKSTAVEAIKQRDMALKLKDNYEFRKLIIEGFFVTESARLVHLSSDPSLGPQERADALNMAQAAGHLKRWLNVMIQQGDYAAADLPNIEENLTELRAEEEADNE